jgi:hypothetical protein
MKDYELKDMILKYLAERPDGELSNATGIRKGIGLTTQDHDRVVVAIDAMIEDSYIKPFDPENVHKITHSGREHL